MPAPSEIGVPVNLTATGDVGPPGVASTKLLGFYVNSTSTGIIQLRRGGSGGAVIGGQITPAVGWHQYPAECVGGLHATLVSGTIDVTFFVV
jgi:hypothetical protein